MDARIFCKANGLLLFCMVSRSRVDDLSRMTLHLRGMYLGERFFGVAGVEFCKLSYCKKMPNHGWLALRTSDGENSGTVLVTGYQNS